MLVRSFRFVARYAVSSLANLWMLAVGWHPRYRADFYEAAYRLGWRKRAPVTHNLPELSIPSVPAATVIGTDVRVRIIEPDAADGNVSGYELLVMAVIVQAKQPRACFEIGTFDGRTTLNMAANMHDGGRVYTLDLPPSELASTSLAVAPGDEKFVLKSESGARFKASPHRDQITQLWGDSATFDYTPYLGRMDLVFVDGAHSYDYVKKDTETALKLVRPGGVIFWHDYGSPYWKNLTLAMNELYREVPALRGMVHIRGTTLVVLDTST